MHMLPRILRRVHRLRFSLRTLLMVISGVALMLALIICLRSFRVWHSNEALQRQIASIQASGDPVSFADLAVTATLQAGSQLQLGDGEPEKALETCIAMLGITRLAEKEPLMSGYLVALACRGIAIRSANHVLRSAIISSNDRDLLEAELARQESVEGYEWMLKTERVVGLETFQSLAGSESRLTQLSRNQEQAIYMTVFDD